MLRLALEIPTSQLSRLVPQTDLDFVLAHKVLDDPEYAAFFATRGSERELILDNSTHEFGRPLPYAHLNRAAERSRADIVIAPDVVTVDKSKRTYVQYEQNIEWLVETCEKLLGFKIAGVLCGEKYSERESFLHEMYVAGAEVLCFTFHEEQRLEWWKDYMKGKYAGHWKRVHILGVSTLQEMCEWVKISNENPTVDFSIDTTKCVKWGYQLKEIDKIESLRGGPIDAKAVLELKNFTEEQLEYIEHNIHFLKDICGASTEAPLL